MTYQFRRIIKNPKDLEMDHSNSKTAMNAVAIVTGKSWEEVGKSLFEQAHLRGNMPCYNTCITDMFRANGFRPLHVNTDVESFVLNSTDRKYLLKLSGMRYCAMIPGEGDIQYVIAGFPDKCHVPLKRRKIYEIWEYFPGTDNRRQMHPSKSKREIPKDKAAFAFKNLNPREKITGDCTVRALAGVCECSWHDMLTKMGELTDYKDPFINSLENIEHLLSELGFQEQKSEKGMDCVRFCDYLDQTYKEGQRIFALCGRNHCVAVCLTPQEDGTSKYKIWDSWDSTDRTIGKYWVYLGKEK